MTFSARLDCHYLLSAPAEMAADTALVVALHGFASTPELMLRLTEPMFGERHVIAALEGPNSFFTGGKTGHAGCGWITGRHAPPAIRLHHDMVQHVLQEVGREYGIPVGRRILLGFSQPVGLNYRFAATCPGAIRGVVGICGGLPSDWETGPYERVQAAMLHIARREDEVYPLAVTERYAERLRLRATDVEFHLLDGGHRFPSQGAPVANHWLSRILR